MPLHALALKKNLAWIGPVSRTPDNEHTAATLGQAEVLSVENTPCEFSLRPNDTTSVRPPAPWREQRAIFSSERSEKMSEGIVSGGQDSADVFPEHETRGNSIAQLHEFQSQFSARVIETAAQPRHRERLTRRSANKNIDVVPPPAAINAAHVPEIGDKRIMRSENCRRERLDFRLPDRLDAETRRGCFRRTDAGADSGHAESG